MGKNNVNVFVGALIVFFGVLLPVQVYARRALPPIPVPTPASTSAPNLSSKFKGETGLVVKKVGVSEGYTLIATKEHPAIYLIDNEGYIVHDWNQPRKTSLSVYLLPNGNLLRTVRSIDGEVGDYIEELSWDGELLWEYKTDRTEKRLHHDIQRLPNGNTLITVWEKVLENEYLKVGRDPNTVSKKEMWVDAVYEVKSTGKSSGEVVWRWSPMDHLIQNVDSQLDNYGNPIENPTRIDVNQVRTSKEFPALSDWLHVNSLAYNAERDEILLSVHALSEIWVISRKTGKMVYRWGNPARYGSGSSVDQVLFSQHDAHWVPEGMRGAGNLLIFNNEAGYGKGDGQYSSVLEISPPLTEMGEWSSPVDDRYPSGKIIWEFSGSSAAKFYSKVVSSAQRLKGGNTLICVGAKGYVIEVDSEGKLLWIFVNPIFREGPAMKKLEKWNSGPPPGGNLMFRAYKYPPEYSAFIGKDLSPKDLLINEVPEAENKAQR